MCEVEVVIPPAPDELGNPDAPKARTQGQDFGQTGPSFPVPEPRLGHKSDSDSYARSTNLVYRRKIAKQKARMK